MADLKAVPPVSDGVRWEDPPLPNMKHNMVWPDRLAPLMAQPQRWAIVGIYRTQGAASSTASNLNSGRYRTPPGRWEFITRTVGGEFRLYARYLGPEE